MMYWPIGNHVSYKDIWYSESGYVQILQNDLDLRPQYDVLYFLIKFSIYIKGLCRKKLQNPIKRFS